MTAGTALHHRIDGPDGAPVVVLGPSLGTDLHLFDAQVATLADRYRVVRYDLPGHGGTPVTDGPYTMAGLAEAVVALLDRLGIDRVHYAGVSIGGAIGQQLALDHPERVLSLTAIASAARFADPDSWPQRAAGVRENGTESMVASRPGVWYVQSFAGTEEAARLLGMLRATAAEGYAGCCEAISTFDVRERLADLRVPVLAIAGADDPATPPEMVREIADRAPDGRFEVVACSAHLLNTEKPVQVTGLLAEHIASVGAGRS
ncbi:3-oxoadipate enol-lactonase [Pseudonocardia parietis]|uniref:3-oxoadipate enol-lactonase n=1 Tax=Pseudonocardia parietis TaxID=570936 RepID=A0ABS4VL02_9PSEU|nr:3-oxoadipate enol-lactonase [Pseudonocardia parietis]MBP2364562.1 3-oxoadipate enol-lactonase [Pseudonocardia parietis]